MKPTLKFLLLLALSLFITDSIQAQTFFEGVQGQTSINLPLGGITRINTTANSLKIGYYYNRSDKDIVLGVDASGISNNGLAPLVTNKEISPEANINVNVGFKNISTDDSNLSGYDYLNFSLGIGAAQYELIDSDSPFEQQVTTKSFNKIKIGASYNYYLNGNTIFGVYTGYEKTNNITSLNELTIQETTPISIDSSGTERNAELEYTAWEGEFKTVNQFFFYLDYIYIPDFFSNRVALSIYTRSRFNTIQNMTNAGFGIYLNRQGTPLKIVGGLIYEFEDLSDSGDTGTTLGQRGTLGIVLGYNF